MENTLTPRDAEAPALPVVDVTRVAIPAADLEVAIANAALDPDGQVYPWRPGYPHVGGTVVCDGQLWVVASKEHGPGEDEPTAIVHLVGEGHDGEALATREQLRPVTWTAGDEIAMELGRHLAGGAA